MAEAGTLRRYVPLDVTESMVLACADELVDEFPGLRVHGIVGDFERHLPHVPEPDGPRIVAFLGGTIGNFTPGTRRRFLRAIAKLLRPGVDHLLLGTDLVKDPAVLEAAYDDSAGVTAEFNRNVLRVINRELDADFDVDAFEHVAFFDREREWIEMRLRAERRMDVHVGRLGLDVELRAARGAAHGDQREVHDQAPGRRPGGVRPRAARGPHRPRRALRAVAQRPPRGMTARSRVPSPRGLTTVSVPSRAPDAVRQPAQARARVGRGAADAVVAHLDDQLAPGDRHLHRGGRRLRVLGHVGQRLGDDEVGGGLDRRRQPVGRRLEHLDRDGRAPGEGLRPPRPARAR